MIVNRLELVPALTLWQPWALFVVEGLKCQETRSWFAPPQYYGGILAIHAGKDFPPEAQVAFQGGPLYTALTSLGYHRPGDLPFGAILGFVWLDRCLPIRADDPMPEPERSYGDYTPGRVKWLLRHPYRLATPLPMRGRQKVWSAPIPDTLIAEYRAFLQRMG